jgi:hypothetical protein
MFNTLYVCIPLLFTSVCLPEDQANRYGVYAHQFPTQPYVGNTIIVTHKRYQHFDVTYPFGSVHYAPVLNDPNN